MQVSRIAAFAAVSRLLAWSMATLIVTGMLPLVSVLSSQTLVPREQLFLVATLVFMGLVVHACVRVALARESRSWKWLTGAYATSLLAVFWMMLDESGSLLAWAGFLLFANIGGCAIYLCARPAFSGR